MKNILWLLAILGIVAFLGGIAERLIGSYWLFSPQGYWRGAMAFWMLAVTLKMISEEKK